METKIIQFALLFCALSFVVACTAPQPPAKVAIDKEKIKEEIQAKENEFAALYNTKELKSIGYYADDAVTYAQNRAPIIGKEAIVAYLKAGIDSSSEGNKLSFLTHEVFPSNDGNQVVEIGYYELVDSTGYLLNRGNYMVLFEKRDGKYVSVREMSASDLPLE